MDKKKLVNTIKWGAQSKATSLDLLGEGLTELPPEIGQLTNLTELYLDANRLTTLPPEIGQLTNLKELYLRSNQLTTLPPEIGQLTNLTELCLNSNRLTMLPSAIGQLTKLIRLDLASNQLSSLPPEIGQLTKLTRLDLSSNQLTTLPPEIGRLTALTDLSLIINGLTLLPSEIGQLTSLHNLNLFNNPLISPPPEIVEQGRDAILAYLREQKKGGSRQWISKLLVVGEGGVGKSALLKSLRGEPFDNQLSSTHGIDIKPIELPHPAEVDIDMMLNSWDFGGQEIYHATHQFFLTNKSLFILAWNARHGYEQGKLYYWLDAIQAKAPQSPIIIVATHLDERDADLPSSELRKNYPQIKAFSEISNKTGEGIADLRNIVTKEAAALPLMGEIWPASWLRAAEAIRARVEKHITPQKMREIMAEHEVVGDNVPILCQWLHDLGDILHFQYDEELNDLVIIKPQWVTEYISKVLESDDVIGKDGIFTRQHMNELWSDLSQDMRDHFLRLMERFDLSYRTFENREISLVVERLSFDPPDYHPKWESVDTKGAENEISMKYQLNTIPAGIPTWFIARSHRFTTHTHWRTGAVFADSKNEKHLALIRALNHDRCLHLTVRGPHPHNFFALLMDGLELTLERFPGLDIDRRRPCPGHDGKPCSHEFKYDQLLKRLEMKPPKYTIECPESGQDVDVRTLLFGLTPSLLDDVYREVRESREDDAERHAELLAYLQREFAKSFRREQAKIESHCPNVFTLHPKDAAGWKKALVGQKIQLRLWCQAPGQWHPMSEQGCRFEDGCYEIDDPAKWIRKAAPYIQTMVTVLKYAAPLAGPLVGINIPDYEKSLKNHIKLMTELVEMMPDLKEEDDLRHAERIGDIHDRDRIEGAALRTLRELLDKKDPDHHWGGLKKILTPEGHYLWLCDHHAEEYKY